ncbi:MAG: hypothetical protein R3C01_17545 [Planctomycetaceae bacterium]
MAVDVSQLKQLYTDNPTAQAFFDHAAQRRRNRWETTVERTIQNLTDEDSAPTRADVVSLFKRLADIGCRQFIVGRHNHRSRFSWETELTALARLAAGEPQELEPVDEAQEEEAEDDWLLTHRYHLREDYEMQIDLPYDLTKEEAGRLAAFFQTLPFESD